MTWGLVGTISRWAVFTGLALAVGAVAFRVRVIRGAVGAAGAARRAARLALFGASLVLVGALGRLAAELAIFRDPFEPLVAELRLLVGATSFGTAWMWQVGLGALACVTFGLAARLPRGNPMADPGAPLAWALATLVTAAAAFTPAFSGHAIGSPRLTVLAVVSDGLHVIAAGTWLGTLAVIASVARGERAAGRPIGRERLLEWIARFSPVALGCATVIAATGVFATWLHVDAIPSLWRTPYGRWLLVKVGLVGVAAAFGAYNWKRSRDRVEASGDPPRLPKSVAAELLAALVILLVTAVLVTTTPPGE